LGILKENLRMASKSSRRRVVAWTMSAAAGLGLGAHSTPVAARWWAGGSKHMASLTEDTTTDKVFRFVVGACLGALSAWYLAARSGTAEVAEFVGLVALGAGGVGLLAVLLGNRLIESFIRGRWWS
jgi:hypothetical protein